LATAAAQTPATLDGQADSEDQFLRGDPGKPFGDRRDFRLNNQSIWMRIAAAASVALEARSHGRTSA
jgi:hypothetical protein